MRRRRTSVSLAAPPLSRFGPQLKGSEGREISTTMAFVRILTALMRDKGIGKHIVPIVPDESRTFGMEGMFRQFGIFSQEGQLYRPQDADQLMFYKEDKTGQMLQEGINEAGAMASWIAAATSYATSNVPMVPFYIDVRIPARRRSRLGGGRRALARLPLGRYVRPHDIEWRGPPA
jgi:pyruvate dehydrogenase E1 component